MAESQGFLFIIFVIDGIIIGILFDIFRVLRKSFKTKDFVTYIEDIIFWILVGLIFIYSMYNYCDGELRMFMVIGIVLGILIYIVMISNYFIRISLCFLEFIKKIIIFPIKFIATILKRLFKIVINPIRNHIKIIVSRIKNNILKYIRKKYKIIEKNIKKSNKKERIFWKKGEIYNREIKRKNGDI